MSFEISKVIKIIALRHGISIYKINPSLYDSDQRPNLYIKDSDWEDDIPVMVYKINENGSLEYKKCGLAEVDDIAPHMIYNELELQGHINLFKSIVYQSI